MAQRKWIAHNSMGYAGTDFEWEVDLVDDYSYTEEEVAKMSDSRAEKIVSQDAWQQAIDRIEAWAEPANTPQGE